MNPSLSADKINPPPVLEYNRDPLTIDASQAILSPATRGCCLCTDERVGVIGNACGGLNAFEQHIGQSEELQKTPINYSLIHFLILLDSERGDMVHTRG